MPAPSLELLSDRERELLELLAQGHTVKSAAEITGDTVNAANELLRSARRKLGVTSSREAARILAAADSMLQKNRDEFSGIDETQARRPSRRQLAIGGFMLATILTAAAALVVSTDQPAAQNAALDTERPKVVSTYPKDGSTIEPGSFELKVTFDRPMAWQVSILSPSALNSEHLACIGGQAAKQSADRKSFTLECVAAANAEYAIAFGDPKNGYFADDDMNSAVPYVLSFSVSADDDGLASGNQLDEGKSADNR